MTLVELTVSLVLVTVIMAASGSLVFMAAKAMSGEASNVGSDAAAARAAADQVVDDLKVATAVTEQTATAVTMTVPDRDADGNAETVRYAWTGVPGDPLTRSYNGGAAGVVAANVRALNFTYLAKTVGRPPPVTTAEQSLAVHATAVTANIKPSTLNGTNCAAEYVLPVFPTTATAWTVTRCQVMLQRAGGAVGTVTVGLKYADAAKKPAGASLQSNTLLIASVLSTGLAWTDVSFPAPATLDPAKGVCLVVSYTSVSGAGGSVGYDNASTDTAIAWMTSADNGSTWTAPVTTSAMQVRVWGTVTTQEAETLSFQPLPQAAP